ncbi:protein FAM91A1 [Salvelinus sp. IW2-2015]|uniref:protein FAM91A1 n=1 Tax=Salvelinus sp. IW2-2015 TaxID=2691554 RepID=UPI000CEB3586|nr:protein FAM91A1-like [Salvelinus alpinus]
MPLFSSELNRKICRKIASHGLCSKDSLQDLLHSSRKLSVNVLSFVQSFQDGSQGQPDPDSGVSGPLSQPPAESGVPLPALNLIFKDGQLREWSGRTPPHLSPARKTFIDPAPHLSPCRQTTFLNHRPPPHLSPCRQDPDLIDPSNLSP